MAYCVLSFSLVPYSSDPVAIQEQLGVFKFEAIKIHQHLSISNQYSIGFIVALEYDFIIRTIYVFDTNGSVCFCIEKRPIQ